MRITPKKIHTPVIAGRVPEALHHQIKQAAKKSGRSMSDELAHRAAMSFQWEKTNSTIELRARIAELEADNAALRHDIDRAISNHNADLNDDQSCWDRAIERNKDKP